MLKFKDLPWILFLTNCFLSEINTSSVLGFLKEIVVDRKIAGEPLEDNIVLVAALNPPRSEIESRGRERDLSYQWAGGHYQVAALPDSMNKLKWSYGSLTHGQEKDFIFRRIEALDRVMPDSVKASLTEVVAGSHEMMRLFAEKNIITSIQRSASATLTDDAAVEAKERARSVVSLRDIQRVFSLYDFFSNDFSSSGAPSLHSEDYQESREAMLLSVATVYYLRLDRSSRDEFIEMLNALPTEQGQSCGFLDILESAMDTVASETDIPPGIATTTGLKENLFVAFVCTMSQTPLLIVGPPGTSKTLAVNILDGNANGSDSLSRFYAKRQQLSLFHYQCSKLSTSKEIATVFNQAISRQERVDSRKTKCVVFMDEAGLAESERESLKVLHYLLEGHMSSRPKVGFVAISNHILDAAKSNRCIMLLRQEPDTSDMETITTGVLFDVRSNGRSSIHDVEIDGSLLSSQVFASRLCLSYTSMFQEKSLCHLVTFFGLRDYIYFLKSVRFSSESDSTRFHTSVEIMLRALERNFNGVSATELRRISWHFLRVFSDLLVPAVFSESFEALFRHPANVLRDALDSASSTLTVHESRPRFKLVIDCTEDDSILRLLQAAGIVDVSHRSLYKLSNLPDEADIEQVKVVSGVKFAALQGHFAVLSQTETINESFYDLFNQRFREVTGRDGQVSLYANIAVGGISRRSLVRPEFQCVLHVRESVLEDMPAPFLNRFEKYRLKMDEILFAGWSRLGSLLQVIQRCRKRTVEFARRLQGDRRAFGWIEHDQTVDSLYIDLLPRLDVGQRSPWAGGANCFVSTAENAEDLTSDFLLQYTSLEKCADHVKHSLVMAKSVMADDAEMSSVLTSLITGKVEGEVLRTAFATIISGSEIQTTLTNIVCAILEMVIGRVVAFRLIQLATPESIFSCR